MKEYFKSIQERKAASGDEGFTLIELLIVIVVLGILAAVVVFAIGSVTGNAKVSACTADAKTVETAVQAFNAQNAPTLITSEVVGTGAGQITLGTPSTYATSTNALKLLNNNYLNSWPGSSNGYSISLATAAQGNAGDVMVYVPATSTTGQDYNTETAPSGSGTAAVAGTGCYAL